jgi:hypothetical protein
MNPIPIGDGANCQWELHPIVHPSLSLSRQGGAIITLKGQGDEQDSIEMATKVNFKETIKEMMIDLGKWSRSEIAELEVLFGCPGHFQTFLR